MKHINQPLLSELVHVGPRFLRSVNLEKDYTGGQQNGEYVVTPTARRVLDRVAESLRDGSTHRSWTLTGPYGTGKSAFAVFLTRLFCDPKNTARDHLRKTDPALAERVLDARALRKPRKGFFPILITAHRASTSLCILQGIHHAVSKSKDAPFKGAAKTLAGLLRRAERGSFLDSATVVDALVDVNSVAVRAGYSGTLLLIDELGKLFEFAARSPHKADVFILQQLAEQASRSADKPFLLLGLLHQSFEDYGQHIDMVSRKEWAKIQGRYEDVAFLEPADQVIRLIASAIRWKKPAISTSLRDRVAAIARLAAECGIIPSGMRPQEFEAAAVAAYPLHPTTLIALPFVFRRFAQNERSLFSYLSSLEPFGFQSFLQTTPLDPAHPQFVRLEHLFDYFTQNFGLGLFRQPQARRWMEAADVLDRTDDLQLCHIRLVKNIGILNALGEFSPLHASKPVIHFSITDTLAGSPETVTGLDSLRDKSVLSYRKFNDTFRIWEGSDVDIDEKIAEGERKTRATLGLSATLSRYLESRPLVARRHSSETGALRIFTVIYVDDTEALRQSLDAKTTSDGKVVVCLSSSLAQAREYRELAQTLQPGQDNLLVAIPQDIGEIRAATSELAALRWVWDNTAELRDDRAARRELSLRIADAEQLLRANVHRLLDPREDPIGSRCLWFYQGVQWPAMQPVEVSHLLSHVCDRLFHSAPRIRNELIVRRSLSSQAAAARRNLIEAMLTRAAQPALGITGFPPERSMYESVLAASGLHAPGPSGEWHFTAPPKKHPTRLAPVWEKLSDLIFQPQPESQPLDQLFRSLAEPPHGVMDGLHPVLLCAFMLVHADEITLYREGTFLPEPSVADFELLMRRPELFAIAGSHVHGARADVVTRLAKRLGVRPATVPVVRALFKMVRSLPEFAWRTNSVPQAARDLRAAFDSAKSPERFLFVELPHALKQPGFDEHQTDPRQIEAFFECLNQNLQALTLALPRTLAHARDHLLRACGFPEGAQHWQQLRETALRLEPFTTHANLLAFLRRLTQSQNDDTGIASVLALVANCSPAGWSDYEVERFPELATAIGTILRDARATLDETATTPFRGLTPSQRRQAEKLQREIRTLLADQASDNDPAVARAALLALADEINNPKHAH